MEEVLIEEVRRFPFLYNNAHKDYRDSNVRQAAWEKIGQKLQTSGPAAKEMWEKLRRCYINARNRTFNAKRSGAAAERKAPWKFEEEMAFLIPFLQTKKNSNNSAEPPDFEILYHDQLNIDDEEKDEFSSGEHTAQLQETEVMYNDDSLIPQRTIRSEPSQHSDRKRKFVETEKSDLSTFESMDEIDLFFLSMSRITKQLPKLEQSRIKLQLSNLVLSAEMEAYKSSNCIKSEPSVA